MVTWEEDELQESHEPNRLPRGPSEKGGPILGKMPTRSATSQPEDGLVENS